MPNHGKLVTASILTVAIAAAGFAWWYTYRQGQRILSLWGAEAARRIRLAPDCELLELTPADGAEAVAWQLDGQPWSIRRRVSLRQARGFVHARQALIEDGSYRWHPDPAPQRPDQWQYALRFRDAQGETVLIFDLDRGQVLDPDRGQRADIQPIAAGLAQYFREQLEAPPIAEGVEPPSGDAG
jgi:hypothetical protein